MAPDHQVVCVCVESPSHIWLFADPMNHSLPGSSVHGISQARILEWVAISFSRGSSQPRDWTHISYTDRWILYHGKPHQVFLLLFSRSVMPDSLQPHGLQHTRLPCSKPSPGVCSNSCPLSWWCHPTISSSVIPFSSRLQSFPASGYFQMSQLFALGGQSIGVSASTSVLPKTKRLLISWPQSPSAAVLEPPKIKSTTVSTVFPSLPLNSLKQIT